MRRLPAGLISAALLAGCSPATPADSASSAPPSASLPSASAAASEAPTGLDPEPIPHTPAAAMNDALREELLERQAEDQAVRTGVPLPGDDRTPEELFGQMGTVDAMNTARMKEILEEHGWPGWSMVGEDGSTAAWTLAQHADLDLPFQELALAYLMGAVEAGDASPGDLAYLIDRVRVGEEPAPGVRHADRAGTGRRRGAADADRGPGQRRRPTRGGRTLHARRVLRRDPRGIRHAGAIGNAVERPVPDGWVRRVAAETDDLSRLADSPGAAANRRPGCARRSRGRSSAAPGG